MTERKQKEKKEGKKNEEKKTTKSNFLFFSSDWEKILLCLSFETIFLETRMEIVKLICELDGYIPVQPYAEFKRSLFHKKR